MALVAGACSSSSSNTGNGGSGGHGGGGSGGHAGIGVILDGGTGGGGSGGSGGSGGEGGGTVCVGAQYTHTSAFGAIFDGWIVGPNSSVGLPPIPEPDGGMSGTIATIDPDVGSPTKGSVKLVAPFTTTGQQLLFAQLLTPVNMTGTMVTAQVKLDSGGITGPSDSIRAFLTLKSTQSYIYVAGTPAVLDPSEPGFTTITIDADNPTSTPTPGYTPCDIREIDVEFDTGTTGTYTTATLHIDTIVISAKHPGDGGADDGGSDATASDDAGSDADPDATSN